MTNKSNQSISKRVLMFCGSVLVGSTAIFSVSSGASALDRPATINDNSHAQGVCPGVCRSYNEKWTHHWTHVAPGAPAAVCGCGEWSLDKSNAQFKTLTRSEQARFDQFQNAIHHRGVNPKDAAREMGGANYKNLAGDQFQIRLSKGNRVTFRVLANEFKVIILQVGGHT